jgi:hypothetical protein
MYVFYYLYIYKGVNLAKKGVKIEFSFYDYVKMGD